MSTAYCQLPITKEGGLAQLARAPALQAGGHRFDSDILHGNQLTIIKLTIDKQRRIMRLRQ